ncbi:MAG: hypothetical protein ACRECO_04760 [Xanthobacteraceae bacterium]
MAKGARSESRLEKAAREGGAAGAPSYEAVAQALREKTARLRALRLAKEASDRESSAGLKKKRGKGK